jgi:hypothetical protein
MRSIEKATRITTSLWSRSTVLKPMSVFGHELPRVQRAVWQKDPPSGHEAGLKRAEKGPCIQCAGSLALKNATTAGLNSRWNAVRLKPSGSWQISGTRTASDGVHGARNAKWPAFGTT